MKLNVQFCFVKFRSHFGSFFCASNFTILFSQYFIEDLKQLVIKAHTAEGIIEVFSFGTVQAKVLKAAIKELLSKTTG